MHPIGDPNKREREKKIAKIYYSLQIPIHFFKKKKERKSFSDLFFFEVKLENR